MYLKNILDKPFFKVSERSAINNMFMPLMHKAEVYAIEEKENGRFFFIHISLENNEKWIIRKEPNKSSNITLFYLKNDEFWIEYELSDFFIPVRSHRYIDSTEKTVKTSDFMIYKDDFRLDCIFNYDSENYEIIKNTTLNYSFMRKKGTHYIQSNYYSTIDFNTRTIVDMNVSEPPTFTGILMNIDEYHRSDILGEVVLEAISKEEWTNKNISEVILNTSEQYLITALNTFEMSII